jgi:hypothetical protein
MQYGIDLIDSADETIEHMPLNETDKAWTRQETQAAHKREGWGKLTGFLKDWSGFGGCIAIALFLTLQWGGYVEFRTNTKDRLDTLEQKDIPALSKRLDRIESNLQDLTSIVHTVRLNQISSNPSDPSSSEQVTKLLISAKNKKVNLDPTAIRNNGTKFIEAAHNNPNAWSGVVPLSETNS